MPHCCVGPLSGSGTSKSGKGGAATLRVSLPLERPAAPGWKGPRSLLTVVLELPRMVWASAVRQRSVAVASGVPLHPGVGVPPASAAWGEESSSAVSGPTVAETAAGWKRPQTSGGGSGATAWHLLGWG